jgi:hypothetical protein
LLADFLISRSGARVPLATSRPAGIDTQRAILDAALDLFSDRSFDGVSTRAIAEVAGVTQFVEFSAANPQLHRMIMQESKRAGDRLDWLVENRLSAMNAGGVS